MTLVAERPGPPVAVMVSLPGPWPPRGPSHHLRLVGALLGAIHVAAKGGGHPPGVGHRIDPPGLTSARGASHRLARLSERALLLEWPAILTDKFVDRHLVSPLPSAVARPYPNIARCDLSITTAFAPIAVSAIFLTMTSRFVLTQVPAYVIFIINRCSGESTAGKENKQGRQRR